MARNQYMIGEKKDPIECSLFYLALRKRNVLLGLWKLANGHPDQQVMVKLLSNDFEQERWKTAAMKNAFALLGKQRYGNHDLQLPGRLLIKHWWSVSEYAAAFFLLGDRLSDAVSVCIRNLRDIQLAILLCRVYEGMSFFGYV